MPQHIIKVYAKRGGKILAREPYAWISMPVDSPKEHLEVAGNAAKTAVYQMLGRFGIFPELNIEYILNDSTEAELAAVQKGTADGTIPTYPIEEVLEFYDIPTPE